MPDRKCASDVGTICRNDPVRAADAGNRVTVRVFVSLRGAHAEQAKGNQRRWNKQASAIEHGAPLVDVSPENPGDECVI
jgi:hypothetical protein